MTPNSHPSLLRIARFQQHVLELAKAFNITLTIDPSIRHDEAAAGLDIVTRRMYVRCAPIIDDASYACPLHEFGHLLSPLGTCTLSEGSRVMRAAKQIATLRDVRLQLEEERAAWEWARHYAIEWTEEMIAVERMTFNTYVKQARMLGVKENYK